MKRILAIFLSTALLLSLVACEKQNQAAPKGLAFLSEETVKAAMEGLPAPEGEADVSGSIDLLIALQGDGVIPEERVSNWLTRKLPDSVHPQFTLAGAWFEGDDEMRWYLIPAGLHSIYEIRSDAALAQQIWPDAEKKAVSTISADETERLVDFLMEHVDLSGKTAIPSGETSTVNGMECYSVTVGADSAEKFTAESHYYIPLDYGKIYLFDVLTMGLDEVWSAD